MNRSSSLSGTTEQPRPPLAEWSATDLVLQPVTDTRPLSELLAEILADDAAAKRAARWELAVNFALVLLGLVVAYLVCVGAIATTISQGWSA